LLSWTVVFFVVIGGPELASAAPVPIPTAQASVVTKGRGRPMGGDVFERRASLKAPPRLFERLLVLATTRAANAGVGVILGLPTRAGICVCFLHCCGRCSGANQRQKQAGQRGAVPTPAGGTMIHGGAMHDVCLLVRLFMVTSCVV
jgi:hypothetical protein